MSCVGGYNGGACGGNDDYYNINNVWQGLFFILV